MLPTSLSDGCASAVEMKPSFAVPSPEQLGEARGARRLAPALGSARAVPVAASLGALTAAAWLHAAGDGWAGVSS
jgi:hypothetical protein